MDIDKAKSKFWDFVSSIEKDDRKQFFVWMKDEVLPEYINSSINGDYQQGSVKMERIAADIRDKVPLEAVLQTETIIYPTVGEDSHLTSENTVHLDAFLYDEAGEEELIDQGLLSRSYCQDCGSRNIEDLTIITHSCSKVRLQFMFGDLLPSLEGKTVVDIGSRIGAVLYGAYYYSAASKIVGIEINGDLCHIQKDIVQKFELGDRISVMEGDMCNMPDVIRSGDVIILNNVFDWFMPPELQITMWKFLRSTLSPGSMLVTIPSLESSLKPLNTGIDLDTWVEPLPKSGTRGSQEENDEVETSEVCLYRVLDS